MQRIKTLQIGQICYGSPEQMHYLDKNVSNDDTT